MNEVPTVPTFTRESRIPKIVHQIFISKDPLPPVLAKNIESIKAMNPLWEHRLYNDQTINDFIIQHYSPQVLDIFHKINPKYAAARADLFRYLALYKCGGVYLDIKSSTSKPLDEVLQPDDRFLLSSWRNSPGEPHVGLGCPKEFGSDTKRELQQWHVVAAPGHPFLKAVIERVLHNIQAYRPWSNGVGSKGVCRTTGPIAYTLAIEPLMASNSYRKVANETDLSLQYSVYEGRRHVGALGTHYGFLSDPVVTMTNWRHFAAALYSRGRNALIRTRSGYRQLRVLLRKSAPPQ